MIHEITKPSRRNLPLALNAHLEYCEETAPIFIPNFAVSSFLAVIANVCGQRFMTPNEMTPNLYLLNLAGSSSGKDFYKKLAKKYFIKAELGDMLGFSKPTSANALYKRLSYKESSVLLLVLDEIGKILLSIKERDGALSSIMEAYLELYSQGDEKFHKANDYADREKKANIISYPCLTIYGMTQHSTFWRALDSRDVFEGWLGRLFVLSSNGVQLKPRLYRGEKPPIPEEMIKVMLNVRSLDCFNQPVQIDDPSKKFLQSYLDYLFSISSALPIHPSGDNHPASPILMRTAAMAEKIATVLAVSDCMVDSRNPNDVIIERHNMNTAIYYAQKSLQFILRGIGYSIVNDQLVEDEECSQMFNSEYVQVKQRYYDVIKDSPGITLRELSRRSPGRYHSMSKRNMFVSDLVESELIRVDIARLNSGRRVKRYFAI